MRWCIEEQNIDPTAVNSSAPLSCGGHLLLSAGSSRANSGWLWLAVRGGRSAHDAPGQGQVMGVH